MEPYIIIPIHTHKEALLELQQLELVLLLPERRGRGPRLLVHLAWDGVMYVLSKGPVLMMNPRIVVGRVMCIYAQDP